jgi:hypothetical protein
MKPRGRLDLETGLLGLIAVGGFANAVWMLAAPSHWFEHIPADVPDFGPFNLHFVRDIGCAFLTVSLALGWAASRPALRWPLVGTAAVFYGLHALIHIHDTALGLVDPHHWALDFPTTYLPAILLLWLATRARGRRLAQDE